MTPPPNLNDRKAIGPLTAGKSGGGVKKTDLAMAALRLAIGGIFIYTGYLKLMEPYQNFLSVIQSYELLRGPAAEWTARAIPWLEFFGGLFLTLGLWTRRAVRVLWLLNTAFILGLSSAILRKLSIQDCGCFGKAATLSPRQTLMLDLGLWFCFLSLVKFWRNTEALSLDRFFEKRP